GGRRDDVRSHEMGRVWHQEHEVDGVRKVCRYVQTQIDPDPKISFLGHHHLRALGWKMRPTECSRARLSLREPSAAWARAAFALFPVTCCHPLCESKNCA